MTENIFFDSQRPNDYVGVWRMLGDRISAGDTMENTQLVQDYLNIIQLLSKSLKPCQAWQLFSRSYKVLLEVICDPLIDFQWRNLCKESLSVILHELESMAKCSQLKKHVRGLYKETEVMSSYFLYQKTSLS